MRRPRFPGSRLREPRARSARPKIYLQERQDARLKTGEACRLSDSIKGVKKTDEEDGEKQEPALVSQAARPI